MRTPTAGHRAVAVFVVATVAFSFVGCGGDSGGEAALEGLGSRLADGETLARYVWRETGVSHELLDRRAVERFEDELVVELLFARAAAREGLAVSEERVASLAAEWLAAAGESMNEDSAREDARRALLAATFERERLAPLAVVSAEEIEQVLGPASRRGSRDHVVFRQIRTDDRDDANRAYARIAEKGESFESVARALSTAPDRGALQQRALREIPSEARSVLSRLPEGRLSKPVKVDGAYFVFQLEARNRDPDPERKREREEVRERLRREKLDRVRRETWERLAADEGLASSGDGASASQETS